MVMRQVKIFFLNILGLFRRALCCFSRRRKLSHSEPIEALHNVIVDNNAGNYNNNSGNRRQMAPERDWNSWDDSPRTVEEHIEQYRQRIAKPPTPQKEEPEPDFFTELTPDIKPQPKYYLGGGDDKQSKSKTDFSRLEIKTAVPIAVNADLEDWVDEDPGGWEELDTAETKQILREKRREMRNQRQKTTTTTETTRTNELPQQNFRNIA